MKNIQLYSLVVIGMLISGSIYAQSDAECEKKSLFSKMPNHELNRCEIAEFDQHKFRKGRADGGADSFVKEGEVHKVFYNWQGEWEKRPSKIQIYRNYNYIHIFNLNWLFFFDKK